MEYENAILGHDFGLKGLTIVALGKISSRSASPKDLIQACIDACFVHKTVEYVQFLKAEEADFTDQEGANCICFELQFSEEFCQAAIEIGCPVNHITWLVALPLEFPMNEKSDVFDMLYGLTIIPFKTLNMDICNKMIKAVINHMTS